MRAALLGLDGRRRLALVAELRPGAVWHAVVRTPPWATALVGDVLPKKTRVVRLRTCALSGAVARWHDDIMRMNCPVGAVVTRDVEPPSPRHLDRE